MKLSRSLSRRTFLRGLGTALALPPLEAMMPMRGLASAAPAFPTRLAFLYVPNGIHMADWTPAVEGSAFEMPSTLKPLERFRNDFQILSGLAHQKAYPNGDGGGDHARASATFLTGAQAKKTAAVDIHVGISADQIAAKHLGNQTRLASLELGCDKGQQAGTCDSGYSCAYQFNLSWKSPTSPMPPEVDPRLVFERLFSDGHPSENAESRARRALRQRSLLDFVLDDAKQLQNSLGATDRRKLDEYLTGVRELELRLERAEKHPATQPPFSSPTGIPASYEAHIRLLMDLLVVAFQTDSTRISTLMLAHDGSNRSYPFIGVSEGHHDLSHHGGDVGKKTKIAKINRFHTQQFAYFLEKLKGIREGEGTLLDQCQIVYGSAIADGNEHSHSDLPVLLAGGGNGTLKPGRHVRYEAKTPMTNLYLSLLDRMNVPVDSLGDSTGRLKMES